jgi:hypothetical protein
MKCSFKLVFFFLTAWFLTACDTDSCACTIVDIGIEVSIEDAAGNDLLNPLTEGYFEKKDIDMYYEINGKLKTHASMSPGAQLNNPEGFTISPGDRYHLNISSNPTAGNKVVTLLRIKDLPDIRLVTKVNGRNGSQVEKIWYKDQLVWPVPGNDSFRRVTITLD